jgi:hypothetical protein
MVQDKIEDDLYVRFKTLQRQLEFIEIQVLSRVPLRRCCATPLPGMCNHPRVEVPRCFRLLI